MERGVLPVRELCRRFGVSPKTAYKWLSRSRAGGDPEWASERGRRPAGSPDRVAPEVERAVMDAASRYPDWGARKIRRLIAPLLGGATPAASTVQSIFRRHGRPRISPPKTGVAPGRFEDPVPNGLWQMDFKVMVPLSRGVCQILSVLDDHSRYVVCLKALRDQRRASVQGALVRAFRLYGLPVRTLSDNGSPWGTTGCVGDFSQLEVWLVRLGVSPRHGRALVRIRRRFRSWSTTRGTRFAWCTDAAGSTRGVATFEWGRAWPGSGWRCVGRFWTGCGRCGLVRCPSDWWTSEARPRVFHRRTTIRHLIERER